MVCCSLMEWAPMERLQWRQLQWRHISGDSYRRGTDGIRKQQSTGNNKSSTKDDIWQQQVCRDGKTATAIQY